MINTFRNVRSKNVINFENVHRVKRYKQNWLSLNNEANVLNLPKLISIITKLSASIIVIIIILQRTILQRAF